MLPESTSKRLLKNSSSQEVFDTAKSYYEKALKDSNSNSLNLSYKKT